MAVCEHITVRTDAGMSRLRAVTECEGTLRDSAFGKEKGIED